MRAEARPQRDARAVHQPAPQGLAGFLFGLEAARADEAVAIVGAAVLEADHVHHAVAVERMMAAQRLLHGILGVADIDTVDVARDGALDHVQVRGVHLLMQRRTRAVEVRMVAGPQRDLHRPQSLHLYNGSPSVSARPSRRALEPSLATWS